MDSSSTARATMSSPKQKFVGSEICGGRVLCNRRIAVIHVCCANFVTTKREEEQTLGEQVS